MEHLSSCGGGGRLPGLIVSYPRLVRSAEGEQAREQDNIGIENANGIQGPQKQESQQYIYPLIPLLCNSYFSEVRTTTIPLCIRNMEADVDAAEHFTRFDIKY